MIHARIQLYHKCLNQSMLLRRDILCTIFGQTTNDLDCFYTHVRIYIYIYPHLPVVSHWSFITFIMLAAQIQIQMSHAQNDHAIWFDKNQDANNKYGHRVAYLLFAAAAFSIAHLHSPSQYCDEARI